MTEPHPQLLLRYLDGQLGPGEESQLTELLRSDHEARAFLRDVAEQAVVVADMERTEQGRREESETRHNGAGDRRQPPGRTAVPPTRRARWPGAMAAAAVVALIAGVYLLRPKAQPEVARITELYGSVQWTGDGGQVVRDLDVGSSLGGGTLELLSADSWIEFEFRDGSTVTLSGQSMLTVSEREQKELHLREGSLSASVRPQPDGKPMLIHTPAAKLEVLGTQLNVDAGPTSTTLSVNEGRVRVTRLADGSVAEVPAEHQVVASVDRHGELKVTRRPGPVTAWQSELPTDASYGKWLPEPGQSDAGLRAAPLLWKCRKTPITLYVVALSVSRGQSTPVLLTSGAKLRIRGRIESSGDVYFGLTTKHVKGGFAGKFVVERHFQAARETGESLDIEVLLGDFRPQEEELSEKFPRKFPDSPLGLELVDWWCCTCNVDAGLSITSVELIPTEP